MERSYPLTDHAFAAPLIVAHASSASMPSEDPSRRLPLLPRRSPRGKRAI